MTLWLGLRVTTACLEAVLTRLALTRLDAICCLAVRATTSSTGDMLPILSAAARAMIRFTVARAMTFWWGVLATICCWAIAAVIAFVATMGTILFSETGRSALTASLIPSAAGPVMALCLATA